jgi:long-chain acyl-CoA synthetase
MKIPPDSLIAATSLTAQPRVVKKVLSILAILAACAVPGRALVIEGVDVAPSASVGGRALPLNGAGLRTFKLLMVPIKVYVASFYAPVPLRSSDEVMASPGPMEFDFTFLRQIGQGDVTQAWTQQFAQSVSFTYPGYGSDRDAFVAMFGPLSQGGVEKVQFLGDQTVVFDQGVRKGVIAGRNFQKAFLSLWFGAKPVGQKLRSSLLGIVD